MITKFKIFEDISDLDPYGEEDWNDELPTRQKYVGRKLLCLRLDLGLELDCNIFTNKNVGGDGYGMGIRGNYFHEREFIDAIEKRGDGLKRFLYDPNNEEDMLLLIRKLHLNERDSLDISKQKIIDLIKKTRDSFCSANPEREKREGVYVEIDDIFN